MNKLSVDFHTHILPHVDDGSASVSNTVKMLEMEYSMGIKTVVATPHFYADADTPDEFLFRRQAALEEIRSNIIDTSGLPKIILGAEVLYFDGIENWDILDKLAIEGTKYILIEMPGAPFSKRSLETLAKFKETTGYTPIIAHLDRYISLFKTFNLPQLLSEMDVLVQLNASSFLKFPNSVFALKLLKTGKIHLLGSDCHNLTSRLPNIDEAQRVITEKLGKQYINRLIEFENLILGSQV